MALKTKKRLTNFFGGLGYFFCVLQWLFVVLVYFSLIKRFLIFFTPTVTSQTVSKPVVPMSIGPNFLLEMLAIIVTIVIIVLSLYVLIKTPAVIAKTSKKIVHEAAETAAPVVLHIQHVTHVENKSKKLKVVTQRLVINIKSLLVVGPIILALCSQFIAHQTFSINVTIYASLWLASLSVVSFVVQYALAKLLVIKRQDIW